MAGGGLGRGNTAMTDTKGGTSVATAHQMAGLPLMWTEALRALVCLLPMIIATALGQTTYLVTLGQGAFFFSSLFLPRQNRRTVRDGLPGPRPGARVLSDRWGGRPTPWIAVIFTFFVCLNLSFMSGWKIGGPLALTLVMIYTAGLNTGSPEKASANFLVFAFVLGWSALISLLPFWTPVPPPPVNENQETWELAEQGLRMGIGTSLALAISYFAGFAKIGWAPSAVGNVVRYDEKLSQKRAWARFFGTLGGAAMASIALAFITDPTIVVLIAAVFAVLNGLFKLTQARRDAAVLHRDHPVAVHRQRPRDRQRERPDPGRLQHRRHHHRHAGRHLPVPADDENAQSQVQDRVAIHHPAVKIIIWALRRRLVRVRIGTAARRCGDHRTVGVGCPAAVVQLVRATPATGHKLPSRSPLP